MDINIDEHIELFNSKGLILGRLISGSKTFYIENNPDGDPIFNSNIVTLTQGKIWYGDIDLVKNYTKLEEIATEIGETLYVLREMDGRFEAEKLPVEEVIKKAYSEIKPKKSE
jgi:hypothetical protein